jgi:hypothetical protein
MEKVYHPCILQTKKRYVGFAYESPEQQVPVFDAKGIETVRCAVAAAVVVCLMQRALRLSSALRLPHFAFGSCELHDNERCAAAYAAAALGWEAKGVDKTRSAVADEDAFSAGAVLRPPKDGCNSRPTLQL